MRYIRTEKLRSSHLRPFIVLTITKRAHYKAERETTCSVNVLKLVSPNQPNLQQVRVRVRVEDISAKTRASSVNPLNNSCFLVGILCLNSPTIPVFK